MTDANNITIRKSILTVYLGFWNMYSLPTYGFNTKKLDILNEGCRKNQIYINVGDSITNLQIEVTIIL